MGGSEDSTGHESEGHGHLVGPFHVPRTSRARRNWSPRGRPAGDSAGAPEVFHFVPIRTSLTTAWMLDHFLTFSLPSSELGQPATPFSSYGCHGMGGGEIA